MVEKSELESREKALNKVMDLMRPSVQADGGDLKVLDVDYELGIVKVALQGACGSCALSGDTLNAGVERILKGRLDWVNEVIGEVDDSMDFDQSELLGKGNYVSLR